MGFSKPYDLELFVILITAFLSAMTYVATYCHMTRVITRDYPKIAARFANLRVFQWTNFTHRDSWDQTKASIRFVKFLFTRGIRELRPRHQLEAWVLRISCTAGVLGFLVVIYLGVKWGSQGLITVGHH